MSRVTCLLFVILFVVGGVLAENQKCDKECPDCKFEAVTADIHCGSRRAFNLMARLPATRIVVYDPMTNSFAFLAPCAEGLAGQTSDVMDRLDVQRLVLPTQKIRLLIMPHDPLFEELQLEVTPGSGIEFEPSPFSVRAGEQLVPLTRQTTAPGGTTPPAEEDDEEEGDEEDDTADTGTTGTGTAGTGTGSSTGATDTPGGTVPPPPAAPAGTRSAESQSALGALQTKGIGALSAEQRNAVRKELPSLDIRWARYTADQALLVVRSLLDEAFVRHGQNATSASCIKDGVAALPMRASEALNAKARPLPVTRDLKPEEVALEACRRTRAIKTIRYESTCFASGGTFQMDVDALRRLLLDEQRILGQLPGLLDVARQSIVVLESKITALNATQAPPFKRELANS